MLDPSVMRSALSYLEHLAREGISVQFGMILGFHATGGANRWSDIDLLVVSRRFDRLRNRRDVDLFWRVAAKVDSRIEPSPCGEKQWIEDVSSAIVEIARRQGHRVSINP